MERAKEAETIVWRGRLAYRVNGGGIPNLGMGERKANEGPQINR